MSLETTRAVVLYQGEDKDLVVRLQNEDGDPVNLNDASEIVALLPKNDGTAVVKKMSLGQVTPINAGGGIFKIKISAADSLLLQLGDNLAIEIRVTINAYLTIAQVQNAVTILPSLFPGV